MKFRKIFHLEFAYQLRNVSTWLYFLVVAGLAFLWFIGNYLPDARDGYFLLNAPIVIAAVAVLCFQLWLLVGASVAGDAAARDVHTRMYSLTYTAPASKAEYLGGRFLAAFLLNGIILLSILLGTLFALYFSGVEAEVLGPFRPAAYLTTFFYIILPNTFIVTAIQFSLAALTRQAMVSYLGGALLFVAAFILGQVLQDEGEWGNLIDPISFTPIMSQLSNEWSPLEKNNRLLVLEGSLLLNRLIWLGIALVMLTYTYFRFQFTYPISGDKKQQKPQQAALEWLKWRTSESLPQVRGAFGFSTHLRQLRLISMKSFLQLAKGITGIPLLAALAILMGFALPGNLKAKGVPLLPRTDFVLDTLIAPVASLDFFWIIIALLIIYYAGELVWRERESGLSEIANAAPVPEWVLFLSRFLALSLVLVVWLVFLMLTGMVAQTMMGAFTIEIGLYLQVLFGLQLMDCLLFAILALFVHVLVNHKFLGHLVALLVFGGIIFATNLGVEHKLLIFGASPGWSYTDMIGFGASLAPWLWFKLYWLAWALLLAVVARLLWVRGREGSLISRIHLAKSHFTRSTVLVAAASVGSILLLGSFIFYNTNVLNDYMSTSDTMEQRAEYEKRYRQYNDRPQPRLTRTTLHVEIYPEQREAEIRGTYQLVNYSTVAIDSIHLSTAAGVRTSKIAFDRPASQVLADNELGHQIYVLSELLQPGDSLQLSFKVKAKARGFSNSGADASVMANGSNFRNYELMPAIGYQDYRELDDVGSRNKYGLSPRPATPSLYDEAAHKDSPFSERISFEAVVGTAGDQTVVAPGTLRRSWITGGRRYFHYVTDSPIRNEYNFFSANYAVHEGKWRDVAIQIYYDPGQTENLERMVRSIQASLDYYTQQFGPYPHRQIRFVTYSGYSFGNHAAPINITAGEGFFLLNPKDDPRGFDLVTAVVAHEVAHQWWGNQLDPAHVEGAGLLSESLAWYAAMGVLEDKYGPEQLQRLQSFLREEYKNPRTRAAVPLLQANDWYQNYRKGPFALYALSQYIGKERMNNALRRLIDKKGSGKSPQPTSLDLYRELKSVTPDSLQYLLQDLFEKNTFWELGTKQVVAKQIQPNNWQVMLEIQARKFMVDSIGVETKVPMNDWVEVVVFAPAKANQSQGEVLYQKKHFINSDKQTISVMVQRKPARAGIDPDNLLIDWELKDNIVEVQLEKSAH
ncbi:M1 family aminopeptidase [uncultured Pontibacter sp.]|uniref:ABC transporter permease/M1 family aminopeptidase n=1 Tax=uncultured Pontibacter sp. TaxID=453356 RepID=UPI00260CCF58|nr:M1 family aminopeptidase [uncultured Pontibacter sp.]